MAFRAGAITGMLVAGLALLAIAVLLLLSDRGRAAMRPNDRIVVKALVALAFGASLISIFARLGGGIFTKAADVGADLVGKVEAGIPEDDPRNPAVIADNVGDNVGDCAGMAADLFETYVVTVGATMVLTALLVKDAGAGLLRADDPAAADRRRVHRHLDHRHLLRPPRQGHEHHGRDVQGLLRHRVAVGHRDLLRHAICARRSQRATDRPPAAHAASPAWTCIWCMLLGLVITGLIIWITEYYTGTNYRPVRSIAKASETGHGTNVIQGLAISLESTALPTLVICAGIIIAYQLAGLMGIAFAATAMLALAGMVVALDAYGPVTDNAGGIAEMAGLDDERRAKTDALDAVGNTTKAVTKGYAIGSAGLAALVLFAAYTTDLRGVLPRTSTVDFSLENPYVIVGLLLGALAALSVRRDGHDRGRPRGRRRGQGRARAVPRPTRASWMAQSRPELCAHRRPRDQGGDQGDDHPVAAAGAGADRRLLRDHRGRRAGRRASPRSARCSSA